MDSVLLFTAHCSLLTAHCSLPMVMGKESLGLDNRLYEYLLSVSLREAEVLTKLRQETSQHSASIMQISPDQGQFMALLVKLLGATKTLDIGVFTGYSSLVVALALPEHGKVIAVL